MHSSERGGDLGSLVLSRYQSVSDMANLTYRARQSTQSSRPGRARLPLPISSTERIYRKGARGRVVVAAYQRANREPERRR